MAMGWARVCSTRHTSTNLPSISPAYRFRMYSPMDMGWSVVEGEGVAERLRGGASVDVLLELAERLNLKGCLVPIIYHIHQ